MVQRPIYYPKRKRRRNIFPKSAQACPMFINILFISIIRTFIFILCSVVFILPKGKRKLRKKESLCRRSYLAFIIYYGTIMFIYNYLDLVEL